MKMVMGRNLWAKAVWGWRQFNLPWIVRPILRYRRYMLEIFLAAGVYQALGVVLPLVTQVIIDKVIVNHGMVTLNVLCGGLLFVLLFQLLMDCSRRILFAHTAGKVELILGAQFMHHLIQLPLSFFTQRRIGNVLMKVYAMENIRQFLTNTVVNACIDVFFALIFFGLMFYYCWPLALVAFLTVPVLAGINYGGAPLYRKLIREQWGAEARNRAFLVEMIHGMETVRSLGAEPAFRYRGERLLQQVVEKNFSRAKLGTALQEGVQTTQGISGYILIWFGGWLVIGGTVTIGQFVAFQMLAHQAAAPLLRLSHIWQACQQMALSLNRLQDVLGTAPEPIFPLSGRRLPKICGDIRFARVTFAYPKQRGAVLKNITMHIRAGEHVGVVGHSGSGKSTLVQLLPRLFDWQQGGISLDGVNIRRLQLPWLRQHIGYALQESQLFPLTVRENIALGLPEATDEEIRQAAVMAGADDFIRDLPQGYETRIKEDGSNISGGQRQRLALARVLLKKPQLLILDEATSALDYRTEAAVFANLRTRFAGMTMLTVTHRLHNVKEFDRILVMDDGRIVEEGTHESLLRQRGLYHQLWYAQEVG